MIGTLLRVSWINLRRDRAALFMIAVLPLIFFSIFAVIFGGRGGGGTELRPLEVVGVDLDGSDVSRRVLAALGRQDAIHLILDRAELEDAGDESRPGAGEAAAGEGSREPFDRDTALAAVRRGGAVAAVVLPEGFGDGFGSFTGTASSVEVIYDASNPMAVHTVSGLLQASAFTAAPAALMRGGIQALETFGGPLTEAQRSAVEAAPERLQGGGGSGGFRGLVRVEETAAHAGEDDHQPSVIAYYAAGIGVMFLLFSMSGAAGSLLEEQETGTLERLLTSEVSMGRFLTAHWLFFSAIGLVQVWLMFLWGGLVFGLELATPNRLAGVMVMAAVTALAAAGFGLVLATLCTSRGQLTALSTIVILIMSAVGGSMVPRFVMPEFMGKAARFTFNGWALDGFLKVFWYDDPGASLGAALLDLAPQVAVLGALTIVFLGLARWLGRRWESS